MFSFRDLAARIIDRARGELEAELHARSFPEAIPIPMADWLAQLPQAGPPPPDAPDDDDYGTEPDDGFYEDFDLRR